MNKEINTKVQPSITGSDTNKNKPLEHVCRINDSQNMVLCMEIIKQASCTDSALTTL